jgi:hypothetical protein
MPLSGPDPVGIRGKSLQLYNAEKAGIPRSRALRIHQKYDGGAGLSAGEAASAVLGQCL